MILDEDVAICISSPLSEEPPRLNFSRHYFDVQPDTFEVHLPTFSSPAPITVAQDSSIEALANAIVESITSGLEDRQSDYYLVAAEVRDGGANLEVTVDVMMYLAYLSRRTSRYYRPAAFGRLDGGAELVMGDVGRRLSVMFSARGTIEAYYLDKSGDVPIREANKFSSPVHAAEFVAKKLDALPASRP